MKVFLDEVPLSGEPLTISEAIQAGARSAELVGRIVVNVSGDGRALAEAELNGLHEASGVIAEMRMISADPHSLVAGVFGDACAALQTVKQLQAAASDACATGAAGAVFEQLAGVLDTWRAVRDALDKSASLLGIDLATLVYDVNGRSQRVIDQISALSAGLERLRAAVQSQDWSAVGDLLSDDFNHLADQWSTLLEVLARKLNRTNRS